MNIHVSNFCTKLLDSDLRKLFSSYGEVFSAAIVRDKLNGRSKGCGFVDMPIEKQARRAILNLDDIEINGKRITVSEVKYHAGAKAFD